MIDKIHIGKIGEKLAQQVYSNLGHQILYQNLRTHFGEIDLITKKAQKIFLIEVKVSNNSNFGLPVEKWINNQRRRYISAIKILVSKGIIDIVNNSISCEFIAFDLTCQPKVRFKRYQNISFDL